MNKNFLFAIDANSEEVIVSESPKGSKTINFIERIPRQKSDILYKAVDALSAITRSTDFDPAVFKAMDNVCQLIYNNHQARK